MATPDLTPIVFGQSRISNIQFHRAAYLVGLAYVEVSSAITYLVYKAWNDICLLILLSGVSFMVACGAVGSAPGGWNVRVNVTPATITLSSNQQQQFTARVSGPLNTGVTWSATTGAVDSNGLYTAPTVSTQTSGVVTATSNADSTKSASAAVIVDPVNNQPLTITTANLPQGEQGNSYSQAFAATGGTPPYSWSISSGTPPPGIAMNANGIFVGTPTATGSFSFTVTVTDATQLMAIGNFIVTVNSQPLTITTGNLPQGEQGNTYSQPFAATGGTPPYSWSISSGTPPPGTSMNANGDFGGTPTATGSFSFAVMVTDANHITATGNFSVAVIGGGDYDGPAELPRVTVPSSMSDTPAPGSVITVNDGGDLQTALNNTQCGDVIRLQAGATFTGNFSVPAKNCDINHWIIIRTSSPDSTLPAEGQRATPCYAGVASLEGRPQYACPNPQNVMAKVQMQTSGFGPFRLANGANYYRFIGLEVTRLAGTPGGGVLISDQGTSDHIVFDRSWLHGLPQDETHDGVNLNGMTNAAVVDSYFSDFHCIVKGTCTDAHAIAGGVSDTHDGPFKIQDNFLEASGEAILFGGGPATMTPADIQIIGNHFWKPWQWMQGNTPFVGGASGNPFIVKNHLELKNATRVLIEANLMENCWGGYSQTGHGILLTPKNQHTSNGQNVCPLCQVTDVTIRYVHVSHGGGGIQMATALSASGKDGGGPALAGARWSIHDVVLDGLSNKYVGSGEALEIGNTWPKDALNTITINHITAFPDPESHMLVTGNLSQNEPMYGLVFTNNIVMTGRYPVWNTEGTTSCAAKDVPITTIANCFTTYTFANNALVATPSAFPPSSWPANNTFPQTADDVGFMSYNNGNGGNYQLQSGSAYKNKGTDGKDLGADIVGLNEALANVE